MSGFLLVAAPRATGPRLDAGSMPSLGSHSQQRALLRCAATAMPPAAVAGTVIVELGSAAIAPGGASFGS